MTFYQKSGNFVWNIVMAVFMYNSSILIPAIYINLSSYKLMNKFIDNVGNVHEDS